MREGEGEKEERVKESGVSHCIKIYMYMYMYHVVNMSVHVIVLG